MKTNFKRLFALLLTLCMLASLMVPVAFAEDEATETPAAEAADTYQIRFKDLTNTDANAAQEGTLEYLLTKLNTETTDDATDRKWNTDFKRGQFKTEYASRMLNWDVYGQEGTAGYKTDRAFQLRVDDCGWVAIKIRVSNPGTYALTMTTDRGTYDTFENMTSGTEAFTEGTVSAYIIPLSVANAAASVADLMIDRYSVGSDELGAGDTSVTFDKVRMDAYEYVVVFKSTAIRYTLAEMTLNGEAYEKNLVKSYDLYPFDLSLPYEQWATHAANKYLVTESVTTNEDGTILGLKQNTLDGNDYSKSGWEYFNINNTQHYHRINAKYQFKINTKNELGALKFNVPKSGKMYLTLITDKNSEVPAHLANYVNDKGVHITNGVSEWEGNVTAYLIPYAVVQEAVANITDETLTATKQKNEKAVTELIADNTYLIGNRKMLSDETTITFNKTDIQAGEYILVYTADQNNYSICEAKLETLPVDQIPENNYVAKQEIGMDLYNISDPVFDQIKNESTKLNTELNDGNGGTTTIRAYVDALYAEGKLDWKIEGYPTYTADATATFTDANIAFSSSEDNGLYITTPADKAEATDWFAVRFRVDEGNYYSITPQVKGKYAPIQTYLFPAASETMTAEQITEQIIPANGLFYQYKNNTVNQPISVGYLDDGEYIMVVKVPYDGDRNITMKGILLESEAPLSAADVQTFDFNAFLNESNPYYPIVNERYTATEVTADDGAVSYTYTPIAQIAENKNVSFNSTGYIVLGKNDDGTIKTNSTYKNGLSALYEVAFKADGSGYPLTLNWRPDNIKTTSADSKQNDMKKHYLYLDSDGALRYRMDFTSTGDYGSMMLRVDKAGTYDLNVLVGEYASTNKIYFVDRFVGDNSIWLSGKTVEGLMTEENLIDDNADENGYTVMGAKKNVNVGRVTVDAAGDYLIIFEASGTSDVYLQNITLTPVVEKKAASVGGEFYASFEEAADAANEGDTISLINNLVTDNVVVPYGVTLNLMGYSVYADSIDATASGAKIVDPSDGNAVLVADEISFNENNPQLPLMDKTTGAYHLYNVEVKSVTITGKNSASPKFWFQIDFSNKAALDLIGSSTELRIQAGLSGDGLEDVAPATADAAFSANWADKYAANDSIYITVSVVNADVANFALAPQVAANGVAIAGSAMELPASEEAPAEPEVAA